MRADEGEAIAIQLFSRLRQRFNLGMREYLAALEVVQGGFVDDNRSDLKLTLQLLWCHSLAQQSQFEMLWDEAIAAQPEIGEPEVTAEDPVQISDELPPPLPDVSKLLPPLPELPPVRGSEGRSLEPLAVQPPLLPTGLDDLPELQTYWPISRRSMAYAWRYLRRPRIDGPPDILDIAATVDQVAKSGFFLAPVYRRREVNYAHLLLLIDQGGSMEPFHRFGRDLAETAKQSRTLAKVDAYYFHNVPTTHLYRDPHLTQPVELATILALCDTDTSVFIFSDGGAARGFQRMNRVRATTEFLVQLQQHTPLVGWLNPMPVDRWERSSAQMIAYLTAMEQMNDDGFSNLIEIVRGQPVSSL